MIHHVIRYTYAPHTFGRRFLFVGLGFVGIILIAIRIGA